MVTAALLGVSWQWSRWKDHADDLERWTPPRDLHHYHGQLETPVVDSSHLTHTRWLETHSLHRDRGWLPDAVAERLVPPRRMLRARRLRTPALRELRYVPETLAEVWLKSSLDHLHELPHALPGLTPLSLNGKNGLGNPGGLPDALPVLASLSLVANSSLTDLGEDQLGLGDAQGGWWPMRLVPPQAAIRSR